MLNEIFCVLRWHCIFTHFDRRRKNSYWDILGEVVTHAALFLDFVSVVGHCLRTAAACPLGPISWLILTNTRSWPTTAACCKSITTRATSKVTSLHQHSDILRCDIAKGDVICTIRCNVRGKELRGTLNCWDPNRVAAGGTRPSDRSLKTAQTEVHTFILNHLKKRCMDWFVDPPLSSRLKYPLNWLICSWSPEDESCQLWWSADFSFRFVVRSTSWNRGPCRMSLIYFRRRIYESTLYFEVEEKIIIILYLIDEQIQLKG